MKKTSVIILLLFIVSNIYAQKIKNIGPVPFIKYYPYSQYNAQPKNWAAIQDKRGIMYFANDNGSVLEYDGANWNLIKVSSNSPVRSFGVDKQDRIYVGGYNTFGYLSPTKNGSLIYKAISDSLPQKYQDFKDIWDIFITKDSAIFFQSFEKIFIYKNHKIKCLLIDDYFPQGLFLISFKVNNEIYIYVKYKGIYQLEGEDLKFIQPTEVLGNAFVRGIFQYNNTSLILFTFFNGAYIYDGKVVTHIETPIDSIIKNNTYRVIEITNKYYGFLLYNGGFVVTDKKFNIVQFLKAPVDLVNDRIYKTYLDNADNLWLCLDNGIASLDLFSPFTIFDNQYGLGNGIAVISSFFYKNILFLSTNSGIYTKYWNENVFDSNREKFQKLSYPNGNFNTKKIRNINNEIYICSDNGLFRIETIPKKDKKDTTNTINDFLIKTTSLQNRSINDIKPMIGDTNVLLGLASVFFVFKKENKTLTLIKDYQDIKGFQYEQDNNKTIWISDIFSNLIKIKFDTNYNIKEKIVINDKNCEKFGLKSAKNIYIFKIDSIILFATEYGVYTFNYDKNVFEAYSKLNNILGKDVFLNMIYKDIQGNYWFKQQLEENNKTAWYLGEILMNTDTPKIIKEPFAFLKNKIYSFSQIDKNSFIIGTDDGFVHYDASVPLENIKSFPAYIRKVEILSGVDSVIFGGAFYNSDSLVVIKSTDLQVLTLPFKYNNLRFYFSAAYYQNTQPLEYSYYLEEHDQKWSSWTTETYKDYSNIPNGTFTFKVKARNMYGVESNIAEYKFIIKPPFYLSIFAFFVYAIFAGFLVWIIVRIYTRQLRKQKEYLEEQVKLRTKEIKEQNEEIMVQRNQLADKNEEIEKINKDLTSSIEYAKRIQTAMLPLESSIAEHLTDYFILFKPRDIVSGDFYWFTTKDDKVFIAAVDCTGHGVPGAFMSMIGSQILTTIVNSRNITDASQILAELNDSIRNALKQDKTETQDGMDMALCVIDQANKMIEFSGAKNPLYYIRNNEIEIYKGNKQAIGGFQFDTFKKHNIHYQSPATFYIFTDGYADQFGGGGGAENKEQSKFMVGKFKQLLLDIYQKPVNEQKNILYTTIENWKGNYFQTDDILVIGFKL